MFRYDQFLVDICTTDGRSPDCNSDEIVRELHPLPIFTPALARSDTACFAFSLEKDDYLILIIIAQGRKNCKKFVMRPQPEH